MKAILAEDFHDIQFSVTVTGVECVCVCGRIFWACIGCLLNGQIKFCPDCEPQEEKSKLS